MSRRVLILSASVGAGHLRAAEAVELAVKELDPQATVENVDVLKFTNAVFRRVYSQAYLDLANKLPHVLGYFYDLLDRKPSPRHKSDKLRRLVQRMNLGRFLKFLARSWDVIVNTHFLPAEIIAETEAQEKVHDAAIDRRHRFRDASPLGQRAVRALFHGDRGGGDSFEFMGRAANWRFRSRESRSIRRSASARGETNA